jgi:hypothetical protein
MNASKQLVAETFYFKNINDCQKQRELSLISSLNKKKYSSLNLFY